MRTMAAVKVIKAFGGSRREFNTSCFGAIELNWWGILLGRLLGVYPQEIVWDVSQR